MTVRAIMKPEPFVSGGGVGFYNAANVISIEPKQVAVTQVGYQALQFNLAGAKSIDTLWLGYLSSIGGNDLGPVDVTFLALDGSGNAVTLGTAALLPTSPPAGRRHAVLELAEPYTATTFAARLDNGAAGLAGIAVGCFAVGSSFRPTWGGEWGGGVGLTDTGTATRRRDGGFGIDPGVSAAQLQWTFGDLSDAERAQLFGMLKQRGATTTPFLVIEGGDAGPTSTEEVHWGLFTRIEPYERQAPGMSRWSLRFEDWE